MLRTIWTYLLAGVIGVFGLGLTACEQGATDGENGDADTEETDTDGAGGGEEDADEEDGA